MAKSDLFVQSKHADLAFKSYSPDGFAYFWFNTPKKGKCLSVEYDDSNYPDTVISIKANWKARKDAEYYRKKAEGWKEEQ
jgi:hypothetical protein